MIFQNSKMRMVKIFCILIPIIILLKKLMTDKNIECYKDLKEFKILLKDFFGRYQEESVPNQVKLIHNVDAKEIEKQKNKFNELPLASKWFRKMIGKGLEYFQLYCKNLILQLYFIFP